MSQENVDAMRRGWEAYERGDLTEALEGLSPDMVTYVASPLLSPAHTTDPRDCSS